MTLELHVNGGQQCEDDEERQQPGASSSSGGDNGAGPVRFAKISLMLMLDLS